MRKFAALLFTGVLMAGITAGCSSSDSSKEEWTLNPKHKPLPGYVLNSSPLVQETYIMASEYPEAVASVPCYCGCYEQDGHISNLDCFVDEMGPNNEVMEWDSMSISWDVCVDIAREAVSMHKDGKSLKDIHRLIKKKYADFGEPTPTPEPK